MINYVDRVVLVFMLVVASVVFVRCSNDKEVEEVSTMIQEKASIEEIEEGIKSYIERRSEEGGGVFHIQDDSLELNLRLVRVHTEYLANLGPGSYFACVDLADEIGDVYDVDFFLEGSPGDMHVTRTSVHKLNGRPFYTWKQNKKDKTWNKVLIENADNALLGAIEGKDEFEFYYTVTLPEIAKNGRIWIPIAQTDEFQTVHLLKLEVPGDYQRIRDAEFGNDVLFMELNPSHSNKKIQISYHVVRDEKRPYTPAQQENFLKYLEEDKMIPLDDNFKEIALQAIGNKTKDDPLVKARALYDYIIDNMKYIKDGYYGEGDAMYACDSKSGNCSEFHSYFIALARSVDIPARFAIGAAIPSERNEGGIDGYHCWAEFYADGKWWPVDISEANKYTALATYYFGHHSANRIELSKGRDLVLSPGPSYGTINFLAFPVVETDEGVVKPKTTFSFQRLKSEETL
jgi:hypothetical protein